MDTVLDNTTDLYKRNWTLREVNDIHAAYRIGGMVFVSLLMIFGIAGNAHVLYIYILKFPKSNRRLFLLCLAILDCTTCLVVMPFVIVDLRYPLMLDNVFLCKTWRFLTYFMCCAANLILVLIAFDRYCKICRPLNRRMSSRMARYACATALLIALMFTWPAVVLFGHTTFPTEFGVEGVICFSSDKYHGTYYMLYFHIALLFLLAIECTALVIFYSKIWKRIFKQVKYRSTITQMELQTPGDTPGQNQKESVKEEPPCSDDDDDSTSFCTVENLASYIPSEPKVKSTLKGMKMFVTSKTSKFRTKNKISVKTEKKNPHSINLRKTTVMLLIITIIFIASYIPFLIFASLIYTQKDFLLTLNFTQVSLYFTFVWSFFINNAANPIIYSLCDTKFRVELKVMYSFCLNKGKK